MVERSIVNWETLGGRLRHGASVRAIQTTHSSYKTEGEQKSFIPKSYSFVRLLSSDGLYLKLEAIQGTMLRRLN